MATVTTTIKTELCSFTDYRVYPGRGQKFVARDGKIYFFINSKSKLLNKQKVKPSRVKWTLSWRKANKKFQTEQTHRRRTKRNVKLQKAIVGLSLDDLKNKRATASKSDAKLNVRNAWVVDVLDNSNDKNLVPPKGRVKAAVFTINQKTAALERKKAAAAALERKKATNNNKRSATSHKRSGGRGGHR